MIDVFSLLQLGLVVKLFFSVLVLFYLVFVIIIYRQISLMTQVLDSHLSSLIKMIAMTQVIVVAVLLFLTIVAA
jgi:hypothetical protein